MKRLQQDFPELWDDGAAMDTWNAASQIYPMHPSNVSTCVASLLACLMWIFYSPHTRSTTAKGLDRCLGSFFFLSLLSNLMVTQIQSVQACVPMAPSQEKALLALYFSVFMGLNVVSKNLFIHRYLLEKAFLMGNASGRTSAGTKNLQALKSSFAWETCMLAFLPIGLFIFLLSDVLGFLTLAIGAFLIMVFDSLFSILVTKAFLGNHYPQPSHYKASRSEFCNPQMKASCS
jgi:hypothetical protein